MAGAASTPGRGRAGAIIEGINVTPLVDIMLVLLVIFIVTAKVLVTPAVPLDLPKVARADEIQVVFAVTIPVQGETRVDGQPVADEAALAALAAAAVARDRDLRAVIQADGAVPHRRVVRALDALRRAGVEKVAVATQLEDQGAR
ncbi:MAG TPA: biopolymer transporter ExbD [Polyangia bacterium]|nr:biopolymer transporter ExbD [Polyangia bacterium]